MITLTLALALSVQGPSPAPLLDNPVELGKVAWKRDFAAALAAAKKTDKPLLVLFQEVPG